MVDRTPDEIPAGMEGLTEDSESIENVESQYRQNRNQADKFFNSKEDIQDRQEEVAEKQHDQRVSVQEGQVKTEEPSIWDSIGRSVSIGATDAVNEIDKTFGISDTLKNYYGVDLQLGENTFLFETDEDLGLHPRNTFEALGSTFSQFLLPFGPAVKGVSKVTKSAQVLSKSPKLKIALDGMIAGAPVDAFAFDPEDPNIGNFLASTSVISDNPTALQAVNEFLATAPEDSELVNRGKNALVGILAGALTEGLFHGASKLLGRKAARAKEFVKEVDEYSKAQAEQVADVIENAKNTMSEDQVVKTQETIQKGIQGIENGQILDDSVGANISRLSDEDLDKAATIFKDISKGKSVDLPDDETIPINMRKLVENFDLGDSPEQVITSIKSLGRLLKDTGKLPRDIPFEESVKDITDILGVSDTQFISNLQKTVGGVEDAMPYVQASRISLKITSKRADDAVKKFLADDSVVNEATMNRAIADVSQIVEATSGLATASGRLLQKHKEAMKTTFKEEHDLIKMDMINRVINPSKKIAKTTAARAQKIKEKKFISKRGGVKGAIEDIEGADLERTKAMVGYLHKSFAARTRDALLEVYINGLLSNPKTQLVNAFGNSSAFVTTVMERAWAGIRNDAVDGVHIGEFQQMLMATWESKIDFFSTMYSAIRKGPSDFAVKMDFIRPHSRALSAARFNQTGVTGKAIDFMGSLVSLPGRALMSADEAFKLVNYRAEVRALSHRKAIRDLGKLPETAEDFKFVKDQRTKHMQNVPRDIEEAAKEFSSRNTFTNKLENIEVIDEATGQVKELRGMARNFQRVIEADQTGLTKIFIPFFQTPANLLAFTFHRVPGLNKLSKVIQRELSSPDRAVRQIAEAKAATGMTLLSTATFLGWSGNITGAPPSDPQLRRALEEAGWQPYSRITETGYEPYNRLDPLGVLFAAGANMALLGKSMVDFSGHVDEYGYTRELEEEYKQAFADFSLATARLVTDRHYLQGFALAMDMFRGSPRAWERGLENVTTAFNPAKGFYSSFRRALRKGFNPQREQERLQESLIEPGDGQLDVLHKEYEREMNNLVDDIVRGIPGYGDTLADPERFRPPKRNLIGEPSFYPGSKFNQELHTGIHKTLLNELFNITPENPKSESAVLNKVAELGLDISIQDDVVNGVQLNNDESDFYMKMWGDLNKKIEPLVRSDRFNQMPEGKQALILKKRIMANRNIAKGQLRKRFPRVSKVIREDIENKTKSIGRDIPGNDLFNLFSQGNNN